MRHGSRVVIGMSVCGLSRHALLLAAATLLAWPAAPAEAGNSLLHIKQITTRRNTDTTLQFLQIELESPGETQWGAQPLDGTSESRARLVFFDGVGRQTGEFKFRSDPAAGENLQVLIATPTFAGLVGAPAPDIIIPPLMMPLDGKVCFKHNPANPNAEPFSECLSYGFFTGNTEGHGTPAVGFSGRGFMALLRDTDTGQNSDFGLVPANPVNHDGATFPAPPPPGPAAQIVRHRGDRQIAPPGSTLPVNPAVIVTDANGIPVPGVVVTFEVSIAGSIGTVTDPVQVTNASGIATVGSWTLSPQAGTNVLVARAPGLSGDPLFFTATHPVHPPPNDLFANRIALVGSPLTVTGSNEAADVEEGEPLLFDMNFTAWWTWTASRNGSVVIDTFGSAFDAMLAVYKGSAINALTQIAANIDFEGTRHGRVSFPVVAGEVFQIQVGGFSFGPITLHVTFTPVPPTITSFSPNSGQVATSVTIHGTDFTGATAVRFDGIDASFVVDSSSMITATVPNGAATGPISVVTPGGTATSGANFTVIQSARTFVSVAGSDANNCANVATPCRTFDAAIGQVAPGGEVIVLRTGSYGGAAITKAVRISVPRGVTAFTAVPFTISAGPSDLVALRGLTIKNLDPGVGTGIVFNSGAKLYVESCVLDDWNKGIEILGAGQLFVTDTTIRDSTAAGLRAAPASGTALVSVDRSRFEGTAAGCGVDIQAGGKAAVRSSVASGNQHGFCAAGSGSIDVDKSLAANNAGSGLKIAGGAGRVRGSMFTDNAVGLENAGGTLESLGNNLAQGNGADTTGAITVVAGK